MPSDADPELELHVICHASGFVTMKPKLKSAVLADKAIKSLRSVRPTSKNARLGPRANYGEHVFDGRRKVKELVKSLELSEIETEAKTCMIVFSVPLVSDKVEIWSGFLVNKFSRWLARRGAIASVWVAEYQYRGALHYHFVTLIPHSHIAEIKMTAQPAIRKIMVKTSVKAGENLLESSSGVDWSNDQRKPLLRFEERRFTFSDYVAKRDTKVPRWADNGSDRISPARWFGATKSAYALLKSHTKRLEISCTASTVNSLNETIISRCALPTSVREIKNYYRKSSVGISFASDKETAELFLDEIQAQSVYNTRRQRTVNDCRNTDTLKAVNRLRMADAEHRVRTTLREWAVRSPCNQSQRQFCLEAKSDSRTLKKILRAKGYHTLTDAIAAEVRFSEITLV